MRTLRPPSATTADVFSVALPTIRAPRATRLEMLRSRAISEENELVRLANTRSYSVASHIAQESDDMHWLYREKLRRGPGRKLADALLLGADGMCAYCEEGSARTLDHVAPKTLAPLLAVTPLNLVPACRDCNADMNAVPLASVVNPYFDTWFEEGVWLMATVVNPSMPGVLEFETQPVATWTSAQYQALATVVGRSGMLDRYALLSGAEFPRLARRLHRVAGCDAGAALAYLTGELSDELLLGQNRRSVVALREWVRMSHDIDWCSAATC